MRTDLAIERCRDLTGGQREGIEVRENAGDGWILARLSVHDPVIVINAESDSEGGVRRMLETLYAFSKERDALDISKLTAVLG